jgi:hypothetical protein
MTRPARLLDFAARPAAGYLNNVAGNQRAASRASHRSKSNKGITTARRSIIIEQEL